MEQTNDKIEYIRRVKAGLREDLRAKSWPEKVRSIERMNAMKKIAQRAMQEAQEREKASGSSKRSSGD